MKKFIFVNKKETIIEEIVKDKKNSPFSIVFDLLSKINKIKNRDECFLIYNELLEISDIEKELFFISNLLLKYSVYNNKMLNNNINLVSIFKSLNNKLFIKYFILYCYENSIKWPPFLKYYNLGLMASSTKYKKIFADIFSEYDLELIQNLLINENMSFRDIHVLLKNNLLSMSKFENE